jgi:hypothetical protein
LYSDYKQKIEVCLIISISIIIIVFYFFPVFEELKEPLDYYVPTIIVEQIPRTIQKKKKPPRPSKPFIPVKALEIELLDDVIIDSIALTFSDTTFFLDFSKGIPLDYKPRQILEVIPENIDSDIKGEIILLLKIGINGSMIDYRVVSNTINIELALTNALNAAKKSKWEAALVGDKPVEYWIEKIYKFNM